MVSARERAYGRLAVTLMVVVGSLLLGQIPLPGVDIDAFEKVFAAAGGSRDRTLVGITTLGLVQVCSTVLLIEVLALLIPRWRAWRGGGYPERQRLWTRTMVVALVLVTIQSFFLVRWLRSTNVAFSAFGELVSGIDIPLVRVALMLSMVGGTFLLYWLTRVIDGLGAANGFSALIVLPSVVPTLGDAVSSARHRIDAGDRVLWPLALAAVVVVAITWLASGRPLRRCGAPAPAVELPTPSSSIQPVVIAYSLLQMPAQLTKMGVNLLPAALESELWLQRVIEAVLALPLCLLLAWLFNRPRAVAEAWQRAGGPDADGAAVRDGVPAAFARSLAWSLAVCWSLLGVQWVCLDAKLDVQLVNLVVIACVAMDIGEEVRFRSRNGALARVWPVHRLYLLPFMLKALEAAGIPAFPRCRRHRTLWSFFTPYLPVDILVPVADASHAEAILRPLSGAPAEVAPAEIAQPSPAALPT